MKKRRGFVANSSSSSFCIYGAEVSGDVSEDVGWGKRDSTFLEAHDDPYGAHFIGVSWCNINDDETGLQFKMRIEAEIKKFAPDATSFFTYEDAWYNG